MCTATITIGRNVADTPMSDSDWQSFIDDTRHVLDGADIWTDAEYTGGWEGQTENAHVLVAGIPEGDHTDIRSRLAKLADTYRQDAIGLAIGPAELVTPWIRA